MQGRLHRLQASSPELRDFVQRPRAFSCSVSNASDRFATRWSSSSFFARAVPAGHPRPVRQEVLGLHQGADGAPAQQGRGVGETGQTQAKAHVGEGDDIGEEIEIARWWVPGCSSRW